MMKRLIVVLLLTLGLGCPDPATWTADDSWPCVPAMLARSKKSSKKKVTKHRARKVTKRQRDGLRQNAVVPLIGTSNSNATGSSQAVALCRVTVPRGTANRTIGYKAITVYFNERLRIPNCVAYELTATMASMADAPTAERRKNYRFATDDNVPRCPSHSDYSGSGYTRGHMAPAMDMRWDSEAMRQCFLMTNMCPQLAKLNNDNWRQLEESIHRWAKRDGQLIVLTGPIVSSTNHDAIGPKHDIAVPSAFFKVVYAPKQGRAIAFIYDHSDRAGGMARNATTVDEVERLTGLDFFTALDKSTERNIEAQCNLSAWK